MKPRRRAWSPRCETCSRGSAEPPLCDVSPDLLGLLGGFLAGVHRPFRSYLRGYVNPNAKVDLLLSVDPATSNT